MKLPFARLVLALAVLCLFTLPAVADTLPAEGCNADNTVCVAIEGQTMSYTPGFFGISGDAVLIDSGGNIDGVFRIFNDLIDTGGGTGLGLTAFLFGSTTGIPDPSTFSFNAIGLLFGADNGTGVPLLSVPGFVETEFIGNGTLYELFSVPEPGTWQLLGLALLLLAGMGFAGRRTSDVSA
ncbi:MAG: PEP-CTERM sorting domain-containing protein [Candidatus Acidiferrales bacterium]